MLNRTTILLAAVFVLPAPAHVLAQDEPVFSLVLEDGKITPLRIEVPAKTRFKLELHNKGNAAAEFEMEQPRKREKVLAPGASSFLVFQSLDPGEYEFIDEFQPGAPKGAIVAK